MLDAVKQGLPRGEAPQEEIEYEIEEERCNGCGLCSMGCKEPAGLGSIKLEVRHDLCLDCNRCAIAIACPDEAYFQDTPTFRNARALVRHLEMLGRTSGHVRYYRPYTNPPANPKFSL